ncbi:MAG: septum formation protein Maf [Acidimicrobiia bacterium]|nr:septum formation protein Maf [Acidimicrobiia bacterium]
MTDRRRLVLASASPRRRLLLAAAGFTFDIVAPDVDESPLGAESPADMVLRLASDKARTVSGDDSTVIAADTTVVLDGVSLGKPTDRTEAIGMLQALTGRSHSVLTGWMVARRDDERFGIEESIVEFNHRSTVDLTDYVDRTEPYDKAGAYAIQGDDGLLIRGVRGSRSNVMGLPIAEVTSALESMGIARSASHR